MTSAFIKSLKEGEERDSFPGRRIAKPNSSPPPSASPSSSLVFPVCAARARSFSPPLSLGNWIVASNSARREPRRGSEFLCFFPLCLRPSPFVENFPLSLRILSLLLSSYPSLFFFYPRGIVTRHALLFSSSLFLFFSIGSMDGRTQVAERAFVMKPRFSFVRSRFRTIEVDWSWYKGWMIGEANGPRLFALWLSREGK